MLISKDPINLNTTDTNCYQPYDYALNIDAFIEEFGYQIWAYVCTYSVSYGFDHKKITQIYYHVLECAVRSLNAVTGNVGRYVYSIAAHIMHDNVILPDLIDSAQTLKIDHKISCEFIDDAAKTDRENSEHLLEKMPFFVREVWILVTFARLQFPGVALALDVSLAEVAKLYTQAQQIIESYSPQADAVGRDLLPADSHVLDNTDTTVSLTQCLQVLPHRQAQELHDLLSQYQPVLAEQITDNAISAYRALYLQPAVRSTLRLVLVMALPMIIAAMILLSIVIKLSHSAVPNSPLWPVKTVLSPSLRHSIMVNSTLKNSLDVAEQLLRQHNNRQALVLLDSIEPDIAQRDGADGRSLSVRWSELHRKAQHTPRAAHHRIHRRHPWHHRSLITSDSSVIPNPSSITSTNSSHSTIESSTPNTTDINQSQESRVNSSATASSRRSTRHRHHSSSSAHSHHSSSTTASSRRHRHH